MNVRPISPTKFNWRQLLRSLMLQVVIIGALEWYWRWSSGKWEGTSLTVIPVAAWINAVVAFRWRQLMKEQQVGTFNEERYRDNPTVYIFGSKKQWRMTIAVAVLIAVVVVILLPKSL
jgi:hypothetical protein